MASKGRNGDSMLVHMTPGEVHGLQALAMKHGGSLTVNPDTGLPEANFLKSLLPMLAGFALGPAGFGLVSSAMGAGAIVGGITGIATGSLSKGLMAGLGAYGGFGIGEALTTAGAGTLAGQSVGSGVTADMAYNLADAGVPEAVTQGNVEAAKQAVQQQAVTPFDKMTAGAKAITSSPEAFGNFAKQNMLPLGMAAAPIIADQMVPTTTKATPVPVQSPGRIREKRWDGRQFVDVASTDAGVFNTSGRSFSDLYRGYKDGGGIVALAGGGDVQHFAIGDLVKADIDKAYAAGNYARVNELAQANKITAADVADTYKGFDTSGLAGLGINLAPPNMETSIKAVLANQTAAAPTYTQYTPEQMGSYLTTNPTVDIGAATKQFNADPNAVNQYIASLDNPFRGSTETTGGSGTLGIYNQMKAQGIDPNELYAANLAVDPKYAGWSQADIAKGYNLDKGAYALSAAQKGVVADKDWVKFMDDNKYSINDAAQAFGLSLKEVRDRYNAVKAAETKVIDKTVVTGTGTGTDTGTGTGTGTGTTAPSGYHYENGVLVPNISSTQNTTTTVANPTDLYTAPASSLPVGVSGNTGPSQIGGGATVNPNGTVTTSPRIPGIPVGGFTGITNLRDAYTKGGGSLGYTSPTFKTIEDFNAKYLNRMGGDSKAAYDYLSGKGGAAYPVKSGVGQISRPYDEAVLGYPARGNLPYIYNKATGKMDVNPDYVAPGRDDKGNVTYSMSQNDIRGALKDTPLSGQALYDWAKSNNLTAQQIADATGQPLSQVYAQFRAGSAAKTVADKKKTDDDAAAAAAAANSQLDASSTGGQAAGGLQGYAMGGLGTLGGYSDGGRLLRGPGDGVSDSIPATIGQKQQPARLADGEFVVPARIVSELGNGSTDAGAKKLYAMLDRVQRARGKTTGRNKVAANSRAEKYLPA